MEQKGEAACNFGRRRTDSSIVLLQAIKIKHDHASPLGPAASFRGDCQVEPFEKDSGIDHIDVPRGGIVPEGYL